MKRRQIVLDTETTGLQPEFGHRIIEIGAVELIDRCFTGNNFHQYINPEREVETEALQIHGLSNDFLADKPVFSVVKDRFIDYISGAELIIHNAPFDVGFLNYEFRRVNKSAKLLSEFTTVFDTLEFARKQHPGKKNNLDALCKRYGVDNSNRDLHGALLDACLLADVYLLMTGGQMNLFGEGSVAGKADNKFTKIKIGNSSLTVVYAMDDEIAEHNACLETIKKASGNKCLWLEDEV